MTPASGYGLLLPGLLLFGIALGLVYAPMSTAAMTAMPRAKAGIAAGVLAMNRTLAGALVLAVVGALVSHLQQDRLATLLAGGVSGLDPERTELDSLLAGSPAARARLESLDPGVAAAVERTVEDTFTYALARGMWVMVALCALGALLTYRFLPARTPDAAQDEEAAASPHHRMRLHV